jgi:3-oxoacyl-[acyl-carrier protein] reductase
MDLGLRGKRAVVLAASAGLGLAVARALAAEGCRVAICSRERERIDAAAASLRAATGAEVLAAAVDVTQAGSLTSWIDEVATGWGGLDIVVSNAGGPAPGRFEDLGPDAWDAAYRLTLRSALETMRAAGPHLGPGSAVVLMTSLTVKEPLGNLVLSTIFRAGVSALAKVLADEWAVRGIRVNQLIPGRIVTARVAAMDEATARRRGVTLAEVRSGQEAAIPMGRYGDPEEFARAAVFLVSDAASYITGASLAVDGGLIRSIT